MQAAINRSSGTENTMRKEVPSPAEPDLQSAIFYLGRDSRGRWVAQDAGHRRGGWRHQANISGLAVDRRAGAGFDAEGNGTLKPTALASSATIPSCAPGI